MLGLYIRLPASAEGTLLCDETYSTMEINVHCAVAYSHAWSIIQN